MFLHLDPSASGVNQSLSWPLKLWASVMRRAVVDWVLYREHEDPKLSKLGKSADDWLFLQEAAREDLGTFHSLCEIMNLPPSLVRERILNMTEEDARRLRGMEFGDDS